MLSIIFPDLPSPTGVIWSFTVQYLAPLNAHSFYFDWFQTFFFSCIHPNLHPSASPPPPPPSFIQLSNCAFAVGFRVPFFGEWSADHTVRPVAARLLPHIPFSASLISPALPELIKNLLDN